MQSKDPFIGRYPASDHQDLIQVVGPGAGVLWRLSQCSTTWFSGVGAPTTTAFPGALANNLYYDAASGNIWQFSGSAWVQLVTPPSGSYIYFEDDFTNSTPVSDVTGEFGFVGEQNWVYGPIHASGSTIFPESGTQMNPGIINIAAEGLNTGVSLFRGGTFNFESSAPLGILGSFSDWRIDCWFSTTNISFGTPFSEYAVRIGFCTVGQEVADAPSGGAWIEYDYANANSSLGFVLRTANAGTSTYVPLGIPPLGINATIFNHVTLTSPTPGTIVCNLVVQAESLSASVTSSTNIDTTNVCMPIMQMISRGESAANLLVDRFSYSAPTGRI
jgi:hypothetical protein